MMRMLAVAVHMPAPPAQLGAITRDLRTWQPLDLAASVHD